MSWPLLAWQQQAVRQFHIAPSEFWAMPVAQWLALIDPADRVMDRTALNQLMERHPDG